MHAYATNPDHRRIVIGTLGMASFAAQQWMSGWVTALSDLIGLPLAVPTAFGLFGASYFAFQRWGWTSEWAQWLGIARAPDLSGTWTGTVRTGRDDFENEHPATFHIDQWWDRISIRGEFENSRFRSLSASFRWEGAAARLTYQYRNEPRPSAKEGMESHTGTATLRVREGGTRLEGEYFTGRGRQTVGEIRLEQSE